MQTLRERFGNLAGGFSRNDTRILELEEVWNQVQPAFSKVIEEVVNQTLMLERRRGIITRSVSVDRSKTAMESLLATDRNLNLYSEADHKEFEALVARMPAGEGPAHVLIKYFPLLEQPANVAELAREYDLRGLEPVDPQALLADNNPSHNCFAVHKCPCITYWDLQGMPVFLEVYQAQGHQLRMVRGFDGNIAGTWWWAGVQKT